MTVYLDVIWLLNFFFDALLLLLTSLVVKRKVNKWRILLGAFIGSLIVLFYFTPVVSIVAHPVGKLFYSIIIVYAAFGFLKFRYFLKNLITFYFITFMIGGGMLGLHYYFQTDIAIVKSVIATKTSGFGDPVSWITVVVGFPLVWYFSKMNMEEIEMTKIHYEQIVDVHITINEKKILVKGLIDSGNQLYDPITQTPVMILDYEKALECVPQSVITQINQLETFNFDNIDLKWAKRIRIIPFRGVGSDHQLLLAIRPDEVCILTNEKEIRTKKVFIGISHSVLSSSEDYNCILHPRMLTHSNHQSA
ncbi:sigma-E processing peptidase SpoIIGA [Calidifontibacillus erzurumensis]|uniref:sigma-E processing peptidase SpoIIGA n=1 Tax=Calidifontibacillus erzurumensis TaxID=2741433 RepID=UPI0035B54289